MTPSEYKATLDKLHELECHLATEKKARLAAERELKEIKSGPSRGSSRR